MVFKDSYEILVDSDDYFTFGGNVEAVTVPLN